MSRWVVVKTGERFESERRMVELMNERNHALLSHSHSHSHFIFFF